MTASDCPVFVGSLSGSPELSEICKQAGPRVVVVTDSNVQPLHADGLLKQLRLSQIKADLVVLQAGERHKTRNSKSWLEDQLFTLECGRDTVLLALGGGVVTDMVGFVAATYCRGIPVVYIPTTLLAMVDAAIGGKTGINTPYGKNTIGTFTLPKAVFIDTNFLTTLPAEEYRGAFSEILKHALIMDKPHFEQLERVSCLESLRENKEVTASQTLIKQSIEIKTRITTEDRGERNLRECLNFGHTVGHALELISDYALSHGQAVALGILVEAQLSAENAGLDRSKVTRIADLIQKWQVVSEKALGFLTKVQQCQQTKQAFMKALTRDKKCRRQTVRCVLLKDIGVTEVRHQQYAQEVTVSMIDTSLQAVVFLIEEKKHV